MIQKRASSECNIIVLASGESKRMKGRDKLLMTYRGETMLGHSIKEAIESEAGRVLVVIPPNSIEKHNILNSFDVSVVECTSSLIGISASIKCGLKSLGKDVSGVIISLADMPEIRASHYNKLLTEFETFSCARIFRSVSSAGVAGNPVLFEKSYFHHLINLTGDSGAKLLIKSEKKFVKNVYLPGDVAMIDIDTTEDWELWKLRKNERLSW